MHVSFGDFGSFVYFEFLLDYLELYLQSLVVLLHLLLLLVVLDDVVGQFLYLLHVFQPLALEIFKEGLVGLDEIVDLSLLGGVCMANRVLLLTFCRTRL
jgi:hypothetical protein